MSVEQDFLFGGDIVATAPAPAPEPRRARKKDPATSQDAAAKVEQFAGSHYQRIEQAMKLIAKPCGAEQISAQLLRGGVKMDAYQVRKRLPEMEKAGTVATVVDVIEGTDAVRETSSGRRERLWRLVA